MINEQLDELIQIRHDLHTHPELMFQEERTSGVVKTHLDAEGIQHVDGLAKGTGVLGYLPGDAGRAIGLRADMDALPILEKTGLPYASAHEGRMHACGHDGHTTILIGTAKILARIQREHGLPRPVTFLFQPAEEGGAGGDLMVQEGCLDGSLIGEPLENIFGLHGWPQTEQGAITTRVGPIMAESDRFEITIRGEGSHAAWPHGSRDPIIAANAILTALQSIVSRNTSPTDSVVISTTMFNAGTAFNVIPSEAKLAGTVRTIDGQVKARTIERMEQIVASIAAAHECTAELDYRHGYPVLVNDAEAVELLREAGVGTLGAQNVHDMVDPVMGGEDFAYFAREIPACFFGLGLIPRGSDSMPLLHQDTFDFNDAAIAHGIEIFCRLALRSA
ncbi:MAG: hypothetical protein CMJ32_07525 [Phycisphaerae bacterium]|nr:hypothetical protein [Phycisphaerae bacterium]